jgi:hypothetical protein
MTCKFSSKYQLAGRPTVLEEANTEIYVKGEELYEVCRLDCKDSWWDQQDGYCCSCGGLRINMSTICYYFTVTHNNFINLPDIPKYICTVLPFGSASCSRKIGVMKLKSYDLPRRVDWSITILKLNYYNTLILMTLE